jgi:biotin operon repressor
VKVTYANVLDLLEDALEKHLSPQLDLTYEPQLDRERLAFLLGAVLDQLRTGAWRTLEELRERIGKGSEAGISARIRELRTMGFVIERRRRPGVAKARALFEYRLLGGQFRTI